MLVNDENITEILEWPELEDVKAELEDYRFLTRSHGTGGTAALGCHGPLCRKLERDKRRRRTERKAKREGREVELRDRIYDRDALLEAITTWHKMQIFLRRMENSA